MSRPSLVAASASVVIRGEFDPIRLAPTTLRKQGFLTESEEDSVDIEVVFRDVVKFATDSMLVFATRDKILMRAEGQENEEPLKDIWIGIIRSLSDIVVSKVGLNHDRRYSFAAEQDWHALGNRLAPKAVWGDTLESPGLLALVLKSQRPDALDGYIHTKVEPFQNDDVPFGVLVDVNDHFDFADNSDAVGSDEVARFIGDHWRDARLRATAIFEKAVQT